jgi:glycosyltransferase involved in cell wall biosynthesis
MNITPSTESALRPIALLISMYFPPEPGGGATAAWNRALILHKIGYSVFVICGFPSYPTGKVVDPVYENKSFYIEKSENFTLIRLRLLPLESKGYLRRFVLFTSFILLCLFWIPRILTLVRGIKLVYAIAPILFSSFVGFMYSKITRSFFIYEASDLWPEELVAFKTKLSFIIFFIGKILAKISYSLPDMIVVTTKLASKYVTNNYKPKVIIYDLPIGVEPSNYQIKSKEYARKVLIEKKIIPSDLVSKFIILYAGIISKVTRVENIIYAANELNGKENNISFLVIGEGEEKLRLEEIKRRNNVNNLFLLPFQTTNLVPYIISAADVCLISLPSEPIYEVTVSTKFFDYLACHKPQIGICGGELANIINSNKIGLTVKDGEINKLVDIILRLKNSPSLMDSMERNSRNILQQFSLDNLASKFSNVLKNEISKRVI